jgi:hypothetical protein
MKMEMYKLNELRNLQSSNSSSQFPYLASQTLRIAEEINKHPPLKPDFLRMMFYNLSHRMQDEKLKYAIKRFGLESGKHRTQHTDQDDSFDTNMLYKD